MISALDVLFGLASGQERCALCGIVVTDDNDRLNFAGDYSASICGACRRDFKRSNGETIEQSIARRRCHPRDVLPGFRGGRLLA